MHVAKEKARNLFHYYSESVGKLLKRMWVAVVHIWQNRYRVSSWFQDREGADVCGGVQHRRHPR